MSVHHYCSKECQEEDWPRHRDNCVPVIVKEYGEKGQGLVSAKDIKMGEQILTDKAIVSNGDMVGGCFLTGDAERLLLNQKILMDISLLNHSCAPNARVLQNEKLSRTLNPGLAFLFA